MDLKNFLSNILADNRLNQDIVYHRVIAGKSAKYSNLDPPLPERLVFALKASNVHRLYLHQAEGIRLARSGLNVVTVTPTASGKSMVYILPIIEKIIANQKARALLLFPLKALAQDQFKRLLEFMNYLDLPESTVAIYDGDTPSHIRAKIRKNPPNILLTNPDMLHQGILPFHTQWETFFRDLHYVVIDELHSYKGVFGSHVLQILHRLRRVAFFYYAKPQFLATSATIANPRKLAEKLCGLSFELVDKNGAPSATRHIFFINPTLSLYTVATQLFTEAISSGQKTIVFTKARKITELIYQWTVQSKPHLSKKISAYRAGYLPEERRDIEQKLQDGILNGVISTSALEMGIDIGGLDVCILVGYPGTITATWQRAGRVGRKERDSAIFLVAQPDALDQYFMRHPKDFFLRGAEAGVVDEANPYILKNHLLCTAQEVPLRFDDRVYKIKNHIDIISELVEKNELFEAAGGSVWFCNHKRPQREIDIRGSGTTCSIIENKTHRLIGCVDNRQAITECHPGAIYLHGGQAYIVENLDLGTQNAWVNKANVSYYTIACTEKETEIIKIYDSRVNEYYKVSLGYLKVTERVTSYEKRSTASREKISEDELDLPPIIYETVGIWIQPTDVAINGLSIEKFHIMGSLHAIEHASLGLLPLFALCDRNDVGGISFTGHFQLKSAAIFLYDRYSGGVGLAAKAYEVLDVLLEKVLILVSECKCLDGCPSCIHSPKCGHGNVPLDKAGCHRLLEHLCGKKKFQNGYAILTKRPNINNNQPANISENLYHNNSSNTKTIKCTPYTSRLKDSQKINIAVFDLETQLSSEDVGGWHNAHLMRISLGVVYEPLTGRSKTYFENTVSDLVRHLRQAELVVGFNQKKFDYAVLKAYTDEDLCALCNIDLLDIINQRHGFRVSLDKLANATLGEKKSADGLAALKWWKEGNIEKIERYCAKDVELTSRLFDYALDHGYLLYENKNHDIVRLPLDLELPSIS